MLPDTVPRPLFQDCRPRAETTKGTFRTRTQRILMLKRTLMVNQFHQAARPLKRAWCKTSPPTSSQGKTHPSVSVLLDTSRNSSTDMLCPVNSTTLKPVHAPFRKISTLVTCWDTEQSEVTTCLQLGKLLNVYSRLWVKNLSPLGPVTNRTRPQAKL